jgi:hypothetical protein
LKYFIQQTDLTDECIHFIETNLNPEKILKNYDITTTDNKIPQDEEEKQIQIQNLFSVSRTLEMGRDVLKILSELVKGDDAKTQKVLKLQDDMLQALNGSISEKFNAYGIN